MEETALHMAAVGGHAKICKILLENGANPEEENSVSNPYSFPIVFRITFLKKYNWTKIYIFVQLPRKV